MRKNLILSLLILLIVPFELWSADGPLGLSVVKVKNRGKWTEVEIAIENKTNKNLNLKCCTLFLENQGGYAIASLAADEVQSQIHNSAATVGTIGAIVGAGLGIAGAVSGKEELVYAGIATAGTGIIASTAGEAVTDKKRRDFIIDTIARTELFPAGLKVAGKVYFPPKRRWPGSNKAKALHLTYRVGGRDYEVTSFIK